MAVQSQSPSNFLILNRSDKEKKEMESSSQAAIGFLGQSAVLAVDGANGNLRKRGRRDSGGVPIMAAPQRQQQQSHPVNFISMQQQACSPAIVSLPHRQMQSPTVVSTGLALTNDDKQFGRKRVQSNVVVSSVPSRSLFSRELEAQIYHQRNEIEQFLIAQSEQLCRALAERRQSQYRALLIAAEESAVRRLREKEEEVERASQRRAELEECLARLRNESVAWRAKATADESVIAALHTQLQQAAAAAAAITPSRTEGTRCDTPPAEDAGSACVDPGRAERERACRSCRRRGASAVVLPCRHLCLCDACDEAAGSCPICHCVSTGTVRVFFS